ncbi:MAG: class I SAM-dependent methyltransferase [Clostridiales bacterium]|nr:class I SAM-dependent methyltransferase [Clostridiales bacterium]
MKPDYQNWMPKYMVVLLYLGSGIVLAGAVVSLIFALIVSPYAYIPFGVCLVGGAFLLYMAVLFHKMRNVFDYDGEYHLMKTVAEGTVSYVKLSEGEKGLDVGCGSGALAIALAKQNPGARITGVDRWGKEYATFSKKRCEDNARLEGVTNTTFVKGDALNLPFEDESFDGIVSNYVYHNIPSSDRQSILLETLRTLKKGGRFAIHDIFSYSKYGDMEKFVKKLKDMGYQEVELIDTTDGVFFKDKKEAKKLMLQSSMLLRGVK